MKPRRTTRITAAALAGTLIALLAPAALQADPDSPETDTLSSLDWQPCEDAPEGETVDCAVLEVPLDYERPWRGTIDIALARRSATDPDQRIGTIVWNPGGPGVPGAEITKFVNPLTAEAAERFDVIGFDPRGVESSTPVQCDAALAEKVGEYSSPENQKEFRKLAFNNFRYTNDCRWKTGPLYDHVDNLHVVEDIERIRRAIGEGDLNFLGYSYGSLMGQQYAERYPEHIRTMVLDGNMDHSVSSAWEFMDSQTAPVEEAFHEFAEWCDTTPECALHGEGTVETYLEIKELTRAGELTDPYTGEVLTFEWLTGFYAYYTVDPYMWSLLATEFRAMLDGESLPMPMNTEPELINDAYTPMWCQDWHYPIRNHKELEGLKSDLVEQYPVVEWSPYNDTALLCAGYSGKTTNPQAPLEIEGAPPMVFIGTVHDAATVYPWTVEAAEQAGANLITYEGWGHTIYGAHSECVNEAVDAYLIGLDPPKDGLSCPGLESPGEVIVPEEPSTLSALDVRHQRPVRPLY
ncbi:alpha/beta hydrolase [Glycomyces halotolerans]